MNEEYLHPDSEILAWAVERYATVVKSLQFVNAMEQATAIIGGESVFDEATMAMVDAGYLEAAVLHRLIEVLQSDTCGPGAQVTSPRVQEALDRIAAREKAEDEKKDEIVSDETLRDLGLL